MKYWLTKKYENFYKALEINSNTILPGERSEFKILVGKLPSGNQISIVTHVYRSEVPGPTLLLLAGVHGDEVNGIETLRAMTEEGDFNGLLKGNVIVIPLLNIFGFINFSREVPDGKDVNRSFPGTSSGSLASRVASLLTRKILPSVDLAIDLHTGGASRYNYPQTRYGKQHLHSEQLAMAFQAPFTIQNKVISNSFRKACKDIEIPAIVYEGGESVRLDGYSIQKAKEGILRVMNAMEMTDIWLPEVQSPRYHILKTSWIRAPHSGIFIWTKSSGQSIEKKEPIGMINDPNGIKSVTVLAKRNGIIIGHNNASVVTQGDALFHIAYDYEKMD
ncbi:MAG TPA: succinylglutamate desuccinylase/aspartoacylase family protein [Saprospiraceae bacterium]|nr:succinylglutamate desuccinylase/aspartoacylase family protein [Saprospiraceae bacterium]